MNAPAARRRLTSAEGKILRQFIARRLRQEPAARTRQKCCPFIHGRLGPRSIPFEGREMRVRRFLDHEWSRMRRRCPWISADHDSCSFVPFVVQEPGFA